MRPNMPLASETSSTPAAAALSQEMLTVKEAADVLRVNVKTIYSEIAAGRLPYVQLGRRIIRIPRSVIASLISKSA